MSEAKAFFERAKELIKEIDEKLFNLEVKVDTSDFSEFEKAEALIKCLKLEVGSMIKEEGETFIINSRMVLEGGSPEEYKEEIGQLKKILTNKEIKAITSYIKRKTEDEKIRDRIYYSITNRTDKFYFKGNIKKSVDGETRKVLEYLHNDNRAGLNNTIYHLLSKDEQDFTMCYKMAWLNKPIPNIQKWNEKNDGEYIVLTDSEADNRADDYLDEDMWKQAVESGNTTDGFEDWKKYVISIDGRGSILNGYDGSEEVITINGTDYYIYRTN